MPKGGNFMKSYLAEIDDLLEGQTPKEKFEWLQKLIKENAHAKGRIDFCKTQFEGIKNSPETEPHTRGWVGHVLKTLNTDL